MTSPPPHQNVNFATRGDKTLYQVYTYIGHAYRAKAYPHLGLLDHVSLSLYTKNLNHYAYRQVCKVMASGFHTT